LFFAVGFLLASCGEAGHAARDGGSDHSDATADHEEHQCGTASAGTRCASASWPRLSVSYGDGAAAALRYSVIADDGVAIAKGGPCPSGHGESTALHCDLGFYGSPMEKAMTLQVADPASGMMLIEAEIPLRTFNLCGEQIAQVVATYADGVPKLSAPSYVDACGL
jgi:hypothetical protein